MQQSGDVLERLAAMPPGADLAVALAGLDLAEIRADRVVEVLQAQHRQLAHEQARTLACLVEVARTTPLADPELARLAGAHRAADPYPWASGEIAAALTLTARAADRELHFAETVIHELPQVFAALSAGRIDRPKAWVFADHLDPTISELTAEQIEALCTRLVPLAPGLTTGQLGARLLRAVLAIDPAHARRRYARAVRERGVAGYLDRDGTVTITATGLAADEAAAACERLEALAAAVKRAGHPARLTQIQADVFCGMLDGRYRAMTEAQLITDLLRRSRPEDTDPAPTAPDSPAESAGPDQRAESAGPDSPAESAGPDQRAESAGPDRPAESAGPDRSADPAGPRRPAESAVPDQPTAPDQPEPDAQRGEPADAAASTVTRHGVEIRVGLATLIGLDERPGEIPGLGPVLADVARAAVATQRCGAQWRFAVTDPDGYLILAGVTRRRPTRGLGTGLGPGRCRGGVVELHISQALLATLAADPAGCGRWAGVVADIAAQHARRDTITASLDQHPDDRFARAALARHIQVRDRTCTHPGCRRPACKSELDHTRDHVDGGPSIQRNLGPGCARHHLYKHELGWQLRQPEPGIFEWSSPLGRVYRTRGEPITAQLPDPRPRILEPEPDDPHRYVDERILRLPPPEAEPHPPPPIDRDADPPPF